MHKKVVTVRHTYKDVFASVNAMERCAYNNLLEVRNSKLDVHDASQLRSLLVEDFAQLLPRENASVTSCEEMRPIAVGISPLHQASGYGLSCEPESVCA